MIVASVRMTNGNNINVEDIRDMSYGDKVVNVLLSDGTTVAIPYYNLQIISLKNIPGPNDQPKADGSFGEPVDGGDVTEKKDEEPSKEE